MGGYIKCRHVHNVTTLLLHAGLCRLETWFYTSTACSAQKPKEAPMIFQNPSVLHAYMRPPHLPDMCVYTEKVADITYAGFHRSYVYDYFARITNKTHRERLSPIPAHLLTPPPRLSRVQECNVFSDAYETHVCTCRTDTYPKSTTFAIIY